MSRVLLVLLIVNIFYYVAVLIASGDPQWIVHTASWDPSNRGFCIFLLACFNVIAVVGVLEK